MTGATVIFVRGGEAVVVTAGEAAHLEEALDRQLAVCEVQGRRVPRRLLAFRAIALEVAESDRQKPSGADSRRAAGDDAAMLTVRQAAAVLGVSPRTIERRIADGDIASTKIGGCRRIYRSDLEREVA